MRPSEPSAHPGPPASLVLALSVAAAMAAAPLCAAPLDAGELQPQVASPGLPGIDGSAGATPSGAHGDGATPDAVQMLLQMQQPSSATHEASARAAPETAAAAGATQGAGRAPDAAVTLATTLKALKSDFLGMGSGKAGELAPGRAAVLGDERAALVGGAGGSPAEPGFDRPTVPQARSSTASAAGGSLLANPVVRFIREHRALSIAASIGLLAAVWFTSHYRGRSRRRR